MDKRLLWLLTKDHGIFASDTLKYWFTNQKKQRQKMTSQPMLDRIERTLKKRPPSKRQADAGVMVLLTDEPSPKVLFTRRASHLNSHAGEVAFAGGKREIGDLSNASVALREMKEELGLNPYDIRILGELPSIQSKLGLWVRPVVGVMPKDAVLKIQEEEIESVFFVELKDLLKAKSIVHTMKYRGTSLVVPSFQFQGYIIWGLTARIVVNLMKICFNRVIYFPMVYIATGKTKVSTTGENKSA